MYTIVLYYVNALNSRLKKEIWSVSYHHDLTTCCGVFEYMELTGGKMSPPLSSGCLSLSCRSHAEARLSREDKFHQLLLKHRRIDLQRIEKTYMSNMVAVLCII